MQTYELICDKPRIANVITVLYCHIVYEKLSVVIFNGI